MPECQACGMFTEHVAEYHPYFACMLKKAGFDDATVKANMGAVLDYGRKLERLGLSNEALIRDVVEAERATPAKGDG